MKTNTNLPEELNEDLKNNAWFKDFISNPGKNNPIVTNVWNNTKISKEKRDKENEEISKKRKYVNLSN